VILVLIDSIEEAILKLQERKVAMSDAIVNTDNSTLYSMGTDRLLDIFSARSNQDADVSAQNETNRFDLDSLVER
jgi:hypothetical protein